MGRCIDRGDRLSVVRGSIGLFPQLRMCTSRFTDKYVVFQRLAVAASCVVFWALARGYAEQPLSRGCLLALLAVLACVEKLSSIMNFISVEKDWVCLPLF